MATTRKQYSPKFKAKVALEAIKGERTMSQMASQFGVHPVQIGQWRKTALGSWRSFLLTAANANDRAMTWRRMHSTKRLAD